MPTADRAHRAGSPKISTIRVEKPSMTLGWCAKSGAAFTMPKNLDEALHPVEVADGQP